ncbi:MAG TPA: hypothetical protein VIL14_05990 [Nitrososphaeraceae archaeon]|jgi:hypothetical protein|nr:hypothetical protein [Nitrososphaeraceae archaeon]MDW3603547.1 hypothetical protein [Nitrososphaeraceae archaeon]MDW3625320.1 hypothetical protein [Nitrososphaeraceae archaeon]MDW3630347.1 hypothetical protein [Nitrososphaeraceae archaeon]
MAENLSKLNAQYKTNCKKILELSSKIRYVGVTNKFGRTIAGQLRIGLTPFLKTEEMRNELFVHSMIYNIRKNYEKSIGETEFIFISNKKVDIISFYIDELVYYITIDKNIDKNELYSLNQQIRAITKL